MEMVIWFLVFWYSVGLLLGGALLVSTDEDVDLYDLGCIRKFLVYLIFFTIVPVGFLWD
jgi:hypothetical protein